MYKISRVDAGKEPVTYSLTDLMDDPIAGHYYEPQLTKSPTPDSGNFFKMEKIIAERVENGHRECLVKYLHYPAKFNRWVRKADLLK